MAGDSLGRVPMLADVENPVPLGPQAKDEPPLVVAEMVVPFWFVMCTVRRVPAFPAPEEHR